MAQLDLMLETNVEWVTPQQAALWLENNKHNRPLNYGRSVAIAEAIKRGEWSLNGDAIRFSKAGQLLDGQHRLQAIVLSGVSVPTLIVRGLAADSFATIDTNRNVRNAADVMALAGVANFHVIAPITRMIHYFELAGNPYDFSSEHRPSTEQLLDIARRPGVGSLASRVLGSRWCRKFLGSALTGFAMYVFGNYREEHAATFFRKLETGIGLEAGSPILLLRERLINITAHDRLRPVSKGAYLFKAFRLYLLGVEVKNLKLVFQKGVPMRDHFLLEQKRINIELPVDD